MSQNSNGGPNYNPYGQNPSNPNYPGPPPGAGYGGSQPPSGPNPGYNPYPFPNPPSGPNPNTPNSGYNPYPNPPSGPNPNTPNSGYNTYPSPNPQSGPDFNTPNSSYGPYGSPYAPPPPGGPGAASNPYGNSPSGPATGPEGMNSYDPYAQTIMSQHQKAGQPYTVYPPSGPTFGSTPMPQPQPQPAPKKRGRGTSIIIAVIALIVIIGGSVFGVVAYNNNQNAIHASATATAQAQARATANVLGTASAVSATATAIASKYPFSNNLILNDPLTDSSHVSQYGWDNDGTNCLFSASAYHAVIDQTNTYFTCAATKANYANFTFEVEMAIKQGGNGAQGGLLFRAAENNGQYYILYFDTQGNYDLDISVDNNGNNDRTLSKGTASQFATGFNQVNTISVVANGNQISVYVNKQRIISVTDSIYSSGQVGFFASYGSSKTDVVYTNAKVWQLS